MLGSNGLPVASKGPGVACGWRLNVACLMTADAYPGRGCGGCIDAFGTGGTFFTGTACDAIPTSWDAEAAIGVFGICPAGCTIVGVDITPTCIVSAPGQSCAWAQRYHGPGPPGFGNVTVWITSALTFSNTSAVPAPSACCTTPPSLDYSSGLPGETCAPETFPFNWNC